MAGGLRDSQGSLDTSFCFPLAVGVGLLCLGFAPRGMGRSACWFALAMVGQAAALQLVEAGPSVRYQHYVTLGHLFSADTLLPSSVVALQAILVAAGLTAAWPRVRAAIGGLLRPWQLIVVGIAFILTSATLSREIPVYLGELALAALIQAINVTNIVLVVLALPVLFLDRLRGWCEGPHARDGTWRVDRFALVVALGVTLASALLAVVVYERFPHLPDEVVYLLHARYFAEGLVAMPVPPVLPAFDLAIMGTGDAGWYSTVPPGWPALLAIGVKAGAPWLVNPVLAGACVLLAYLLVLDIYDRGTARLTVLLLAASPWLLFLAMSFMNHMATLFFALLAAVGTVRYWKTGRVGWTLCAGAATGLVFLVRPLDALVVGAVVGICLFVKVWRRRPLHLVPFVFSGAAAAAIVLPYNRALTGIATEFPLSSYVMGEVSPNANKLGFGPDRGFGWSGLDPLPGHGPLDALINANLNAYALNVELFGWSTGSLFLVLLVLVSGRLDRRDLAMVGALVAVVALYSLYWFSGGPDFGARYWFLMLVPAAVLTVRAIGALAALSEKNGAPRRSGHWLAAAIGLSALAIVSFLPWRAIDKHHGYRRMRPEIPQIAEVRGFGSDLVLVRGSRFPDYASAAVYNPIDLRTAVPIYALDLDPETRESLLKAYADRRVWIISGPSVTGAGFRVDAGPLAPPLPPDLHGPSESSAASGRRR